VFNYQPIQLRCKVLRRVKPEQEFIFKRFYDEKEMEIGLYCYRFTACELKDLLSDFKEVKIHGCNNFYYFPTQKIGKFLYILGEYIVGIDIALSEHSVSKYLGQYLVAKAIK